MLIVRVYVNDREVAAASATNISDLAPISDYRCKSATHPFPVDSGPLSRQEFPIHGHPREQTVWALVETMARRIKELEEGKRPDV